MSLSTSAGADLTVLGEVSRGVPGGLPGGVPGGVVVGALARGLLIRKVN